MVTLAVDRIIIRHLLQTATPTVFPVVYLEAPLAVVLAPVLAPVLAVVEDNIVHRLMSLQPNVEEQLLWSLSIQIFHHTPFLILLHSRRYPYLNLKMKMQFL